MKPLLVDNDPRLRAVLKQTKATVASDFCKAADGTEAVAAHAAQRPDWVPMEVRTHPVDGLQAAAPIWPAFIEGSVYHQIKSNITQNN